MEQGYAGCFKGVGGVFFFSSGVVSGIVQYTIFLFLFCVLDDHCFFIIIIYRFLGENYFLMKSQKSKIWFILTSIHSH